MTRRRGLIARFSAGDRLAVLVLAALPAVLQLPWAFAGHPIMGGDNLNQNYPLRVLVGELLRHGSLPLWNPAIWSGTPLLAGWNAGAMYPGTWLFALLPGVAAWEVNVVVTGALAGIGMFAFLRSQACSPLASLLGGLVFADTGFMSGQSVHLGLYEGMAFAPFVLLAIELMSRKERLADMAWPVALFGVASGLAVLAGDPRAPSNCAVVAFVFLVAKLVRRHVGKRTKAPRFLLALLAAIALGVLVSAPQWLPGLAFLHISQRPLHSLRWYSAGSVTIGELAFGVVPFLFGGNHNFGLPGYSGNYNLAELSYGVGLLPLAALCVIVVRLMRRRRPDAPAAGVFVVMLAVGVVLALGTTTPLGHLLVHVPLYGGQRLQNRNMGIADVALCALVAIFVDSLRPKERPVLEDGAARRRNWPNLLSPPERVAAVLPSLAAVGLIAAMYLATRSLEGDLGTNHYSPTLARLTTPYYAAVLAIAIAAAVLALRRRFRRRLGQRALAAGIVLADVALFLSMASYQPAQPGTLALSNPASRALAAAGGSEGRIAVFNPQQQPVRHPLELLDKLGANDLVILRHMTSVQGYGSIVSNAYETLTGAHEVQNIRPSALAGQTLDSLDLRVIATLPSLFGRAEAGPATSPLPTGPPRAPGSNAVDQEFGDQVDFAPYPPSGPWRLSDSAPTTLELPGPVTIDALCVRFAEPEGGPLPDVTAEIALRHGAPVDLRFRPAATRVTVRLPTGRIRAGGGALWLRLTEAPPRRGSGSAVVEALEAHVLAGGPVASQLSGPHGLPGWFALDGILQPLLTPPHWRYDGSYGPVIFYRDEKAYGPAFLEPLGSSALSFARAPGTVTARPAAAWQAPSEAVVAPRGGILVRSAAYAPGWSASAVRTGGRRSGNRGRTFALQVRSLGLLQAVALPPGRYVVTWRYGSERTEQGLGLAAFGSVCCLVLFGVGLRRRRRRPSRRRAATSRAEGSPTDASLAKTALSQSPLAAPSGGH